MRLINYNPAVTSFDRALSLRDLFDTAFPANGFAAASRFPALDIHESGENITVSLEVPGLKKEDFEISLDDGQLTVSGERKVEVREGETTLRSERAQGRFSRTVRLNTPVKADAVSATYTDGVLVVTLPKSEEAKPRKIAIG